MDIEQFTRAYLLYVVMPLWLLAGILDWYCHRASRIELTSGTKESVMHVLLLAEAGTAVLIGLFLEIDSLVLLLMIAAFLLHEATEMWDLAYASPRRTITPWEQHVHDYMALVPFTALSLVFVLHWPQTLALVGAGPEAARFSLEWKHDPLGPGYIAGLLGAIVVFDILPYGEELWRC
ncbi:MAG: diguanylate cyclase, partial [Alphaproteobacteria bacterium]|nr:diguanylate cyclase [Alphaproteobacteria bacterium]